MQHSHPSEVPYNLNHAGTWLMTSSVKDKRKLTKRSELKVNLYFQKQQIRFMRIPTFYLVARMHWVIHSSIFDTINSQLKK
jgi:hypothetical protein